MECKCTRRRRRNASPTTLPSFLLLGTLMLARWTPPPAAHELGYLIVPLPSFPGRPFQGVERASQNKSPRLVSNKQGGKQHPTPSSQARPDNPKVGSVPSRQPVAGVVLHTILSAHLRASARRCSSHLPPLTSPLGSGRGALGVTPNPHPFTIHTLLVIPRFSCCFYCFSFSLFCSFCLLRTPPPCPALLCCICSLTASPPRLASPSITCVKARPGNQRTRLPRAGITGMRSETHGF